MATPKGEDSSSGATTQTIPAADVDGELKSSQNKDFQVDRESSKVDHPKEIEKEEAEALEKKKEKEKKDAGQKLTAAIIVSGVVVAVIGAIFAVVKKSRET